MRLMLPALMVVLWLSTACRTEAPPPGAEPSATSSQEPTDRTERSDEEPSVATSRPAPIGDRKMAELAKTDPARSHARLPLDKRQPNQFETATFGLG